jgi:hypothetical protein
MWNRNISVTNLSILAALLLIPYLLFRRIQTARVSSPPRCYTLHLPRRHIRLHNRVDTPQQDTIFASQHHCLAAPKLRTRYPLSIEHVAAIFAAARAKRVLRFFIGVIERSGCTFEQTLLGERGFGTVEPRNLEALLSGKFTSMC